MTYPSTIDSFTTKTDNADNVMAAHINDVQNAILAIETELGTNPSGSSSTVAERLNATVEEAPSDNVYYGRRNGVWVNLKTYLDTLYDFLGLTHAATGKATPADNDEVGLLDSAASYGLKKLTWANVKAALKAYFDGLYVWETVTHAATSKATPADGDELSMADSAASYGLKKLTWANLKAALKTYFDTLYGSTTPWVDTVHAATSKGTPADADEFGIVDSAAGNVLKKLTLSNLKAALKAYFDLVYPSNGWIAVAETWTPTGNWTFTVPGDCTAIYSKGTKVRYNDGAQDYGVVIAATYAAPNTTVTLASNSDYIFTITTITNKYISYSENPEGYPHWFNYDLNPAASGSMTYGTFTVLTGRFAVIGKTVKVYARVRGTTGGSASNTLVIDAPIKAAYASATVPVTVYVYDGAGTPLGGFGYITAGTPNKINGKRYDNANFGLGNTRDMIVTASYEME